MALDNVSSDELIKVIDHLQQIITPIGMEVYKIYYKQVFFSGIIYGALDIITIFGLSGTIYYIYKKYKKENPVYINDSNWIIPLFIVIFISMIVIPMAFIELPDNIMRIINTDYYIIQDLLHGGV